MSSIDLSLLIRGLGFITGLVLYVMLAVMAWQGRNAQRAPGEWISAGPPASPFHTGLLLAIATLGLLLSITANALHLSAGMHIIPRPSSPVTWIVVAGYAVLMGLLAIHMWRLTTMQRMLAVLAMIVFAASAAHVITYTGGSEPLAVELVVHNASLPLVAALLYQEYRFGLADLFLKRALSLILLVTVALTGYVIAQRTDPRLILVLWIATALGYPVLRSLVYTSVDQLLLQRMTTREVRAQLAVTIANTETPDIVLDYACAKLQDALTARWVVWYQREGHGTADILRTPSARVIVPVSDSPGYVLEVGPLTSGRRLLSGDMDLLEAAALDIARRIDVIRMTAERYERTTREAEALRLVAESELRALHAQLNPHFLFNALTTIGYLIRTAPDRAVETLLRLTELLRAVLRRSTGELVTVREEVALAEAYLAIERARFEERLTVQIDVPIVLETVKIPPLIVQPLVENAIKHGIAPRTEGGCVSVSITSGDLTELRGTLVVRVEDTGAGATPAVLARGRARGVGLNNIERRLEQYYHGEASLTVHSIPGVGTVVEVRVPRQAA